MTSRKIYRSHLVFLLFLWGLTVQAQPSKTQFEQERKTLLQKIKSIKQILAQTAAKKKATTGQLTAINQQIEANDLLIQSISHEVRVINQQLAQQLCTIAMLERVLAQLKKEYAAMIYLGAKVINDIHTLLFIFSATSFQELVQRLRSVKQYAKIRQKHFYQIKRMSTRLQARRGELEQQVLGKKALLQKRREEQTKLISLKQQQKKLITALEQQHTKLHRELTRRNVAVERLDKLITDIVQQGLAVAKQPAQQNSVKLGPKPALTPAAKKLALNFAQNRGKLPWPVETGFISNQFGIRFHPVLRTVKVENLGIDIQTQEGATAHAIFEGIVKTIAFVPGMNRVVIIQHGAYHTVYAKLKSTIVKVGQQVQAQEPIGVVCTNKDGITELQLQLWKGTQKLNPAWWLVSSPSV
ncbi:MAG: peptidoglycan DD-metalloendopeptidase family protein [Bacteroidota bacterium]